MKIFIVVLLTVVGLQGILGRVFTRCELAKTLKTHGFPVHQLPDWVCLVESESSRNTAAKGGPNIDGSYDYGLFQINDRYWCKVGSIGGDCSANCNNFLNDNISDDVKCVRIIYKRHGFNAWEGWKAKCQGAKPDLSNCGL